MLALAPLVDILKNVALYLHMVVWAVIVRLLPVVALYLINKAIEIVVLGSRIVA